MNTYYFNLSKEAINDVLGKEMATMKLGDFLMQNKYVLPEKGKVELFKGNDRILVTGPSSIDTLIELFGQYNLLKIVFLTENCFQMCIEIDSQ